MLDIHVIVFNKHCIFQYLAIVAPVRSYVAEAATKEERTFQLSLTFAIQSLGLVVGPIITVSLSY